MIFLYIFLAIVIIGSFALGIFVTVVSKNTGVDSNTTVSSELKEMMESGNLSKSSIHLINSEDSEIKNNEEDDNMQFVFSARQKHTSEDENAEAVEEELI